MNRSVSTANFINFKMPTCSGVTSCSSGPTVAMIALRR